MELKSSARSSSEIENFVNTSKTTWKQKLNFSVMRFFKWRLVFLRYFVRGFRKAKKQQNIFVAFLGVFLWLNLKSIFGDILVPRTSDLNRETVKIFVPREFLAL